MSNQQTRRVFVKMLACCFPAVAVGMREASGGKAAYQPSPVNLDFVSDEMDILRRIDWTTVIPRRWLLRRAVEFERITVHHVGKTTNYDVSRSRVVRDLDGILTEHMDRNYGDIGYHFVIDYAGRLWEGRSLAYEGAHVSGHNERNIGIVVIGNFDMQRPSDEQLITVEQIVTVLREYYGISQKKVFGHRDLSPSACPGDNLYPAIMRLRT